MTEDRNERMVIAALQGDMEPSPDFWGDAARAAGLTREAFIGAASRLKAALKLKRVGAVVRHGAAGYSHNAMLAMSVPASRADDAGAAVSALTFVSHCYEREVPACFPYNLFAMVHARGAEELEGFVREAVSSAKPDAFVALGTVREVKKESMRFTDPPPAPGRGGSVEEA